MELLQALNEDVALRMRLAELRGDALWLALRFAHDGSDVVGAELASALKVCLQACEAVVSDVTAARARSASRRQDSDALRNDVARPREEHVNWLTSLRARLLHDAADTHREAEFARRTNNTRAAFRLFGIKNRAEAVAAALGVLAALSTQSAAQVLAADASA